MRYVCDGEPRIAVASVDHETRGDVWWRATFPVRNPVTPYRWLLAGGDFGYAWLNGCGLQPFDVPDADDFVATTHAGGPDWHLESVVYEVFPDRFASAGLEVDPPDWAIPRAWGERPTGRGPETPAEWFGGDLVGLERRLDHISALGANVLYLTPIFPAGSTHRYDATSFDVVDPLLGGDEALVSLVRAAHDRGIRVLGDLTTNHVGDGHAWFVAAHEGHEPEREFFFFDDSLANGYESWYGVPSLPKLDYRSPELRRRMYEGDSSVTRRWLESPFALDGWRIDVANMTGRLKDVDVLPEVSRGVRTAAVAARPDALVVAEHAYDARADLRAGGWHGTMNYAGFTRPAWAWLRGDALPADAQSSFLGLPVGVPRLSGEAVVATMTRFRAGVSWSSVIHSWAILDSHDTARFRSIAGSRERQLVGVGLQMTTPGVPMVFAGDEIGLEGEWGGGRAPDDALGPARRVGCRAARRVSAARFAPPQQRCSFARWHPLRARVRRCDRLSARVAGGGRPLPRDARREGACPAIACGARRHGAPDARRRGRGGRGRRRTPAGRRAGVPCLESRMTSEETRDG